MADADDECQRKATGKKEIQLSLVAINVVRQARCAVRVERSINGKSAEECFRCGRP
jgi:hypothetical protein